MARYPDGHPDGAPHAVQLIGRDKCSEHPVRQPDGASVGAGGGLDDGELVTAHPRNHVGVPHGCPQAAGDRHEQRVPDRVAMGVVHELEAVEVHVEDGERLPGPAGVGEQRL